MIPPCSHTANGSLSGASAESSMLAPIVNAPAAIMTLLSYPGISHGSGVAIESTGEPFCIPLQNAQRASGVPSFIAAIISVLF